MFGTSALNVTSPKVTTKLKFMNSKMETSPSRKTLRLTINHDKFDEQAPLFLVDEFFKSKIIV